MESQHGQHTASPADAKEAILQALMLLAAQADDQLRCVPATSDARCEEVEFSKYFFEKVY